MNTLEGVTPTQQQKTLTLSTVGFTICFAVWTIFSIIGIQIQQELGLNETQFALLVSLPILTGSLSRLGLGMLADRFGGRPVMTLVMLAAALATGLLTVAGSYGAYLAAALGVGLAGGAFSVGVAYLSRWYPRDRQGTALGIFGLGNVGAAVTKFIAPFVMVAWGWTAVAQIWAVVLAAMAVTFWLTADDDPVIRHRRATGEKPPSAGMQLSPLVKLQVWRFAIYYFFVFGAFVALALWLPRYYVEVYGLDIRLAGTLAATFSLAASVFRAYGGYLSDKYGARRIMYWTFGVALVCTFLLSYPPTDYAVHGVDGPIEFSLAMGLVPFTVILFALGFAMSLGKAAVFKHIPVYYPDNVGSVGGIVGLVGGLGGFVLPMVFGVVNDITGIWTSSFMILFLLAGTALTWMHLAILRMERASAPQLAGLPQLPEFQGMREDRRAGTVGPGPGTKSTADHHSDHDTGTRPATGATT
ncbi:nitrate/nitrite transporter [Fodinicurvata sp. EGI_FJ10296]|uniref:MFS transporter n=1 Tax=Fodinicurvata sp. EGI_FJ10296 TaxID=3231908 RepID=UPI0034517C95